MYPPIQQCYEALLAHFGEQHWWPARTRLEMMLGAILTQNTAWTNVKKAISNLRKNGLLNYRALENATQEQIANCIRPAGYYNQKSLYIKEIITVLRERFDGSLNRLFLLDTPTLRQELLSWKGIGPETADSILLYAGKRPVFVVDAYTKRVCFRHGWCGEKTNYDLVAKLFTSKLPVDAHIYNEYHALIVRLCKEFCNSKPKCEGCPLQIFL